MSTERMGQGGPFFFKNFRGISMVFKKEFLVLALIGGVSAVAVGWIFWANTRIETSMVEDLLREDHKTSDGKIADRNQDQEQIQGVQKEIETLSEHEIVEEIDRLKTQIYDRDLISQLNEGRLSVSEQNKAGEIFNRLALLGFEKAERTLAKLIPDMESDLAQQKKHLEKIKSVLTD